MDYLFRRKLPGLWLLHLAGLLFLGLLAGFVLNFSIPTSSGPISFSFSTDGTPNWLYIGVFAVAAVLSLVGLIWTGRELREQSRKRVIAIEIRGLRDTSGEPLAAAVPRRLAGRREQLLVDLRQGQDGKIIEPKSALRHLLSLPDNIKTREAGMDRSDITFVLAGLAPVPYNFLAGVLTDDEGSVTLMDWNRHTQNWAELAASDDGKRFKTEGVDALVAGQAEITLAVSVSYGADLAGVAQKFPTLPLVKMTLEDGTPDAHWSEEKQAALGQQFLETIVALSNKGVRQIHLVLAAPNSIVLRFGRLYDKRLLPALIVYQYEREETPPYPWGIRMPVENAPDAEIV